MVKENGLTMSPNSKRKPLEGIKEGAKRRKLCSRKIATIKQLVNSTKGEPVRALYMVFDPESVRFELHGLPTSFACFFAADGYTFLGFGKSKSEAKGDVSRIALRFLFDFVENVDERPVFASFTDAEDADAADAIAALVNAKYEQLKVEYNLPGYRFIAGVVQVRNDEYEHGSVVSISSGSKCVKEELLRLDGTTVIDSHAEVLARRRFLRYLYARLYDAITHGANDVFCASGDVFEVQPDCSFHLYVNSPPCGDCRLFSIAGNRCLHADSHPNRSSRGLLRVKTSGNESTVPIKDDDIAKSDSLLRVMSCSDKILKMNVLGVQGSLLSRFLSKPIYLSGIVLANNAYVRSHIQRGLYDRVSYLSDVLPKPYRLNSFAVNRTTNLCSLNENSPKTCFTWSCDEKVELCYANCGKTVNKNVSLVSKYSLFKEFIRCYTARYPDASLMSYDEFKKGAIEYQKVKKIFKNELKANKLGTWIKRNTSFDCFSLS